MKFLLFSLLFVLGFSFSACGKDPKVNDNYYDRANKASAGSLESLDRDAK